MPIAQQLHSDLISCLVHNTSPAVLIIVTYLERFLTIHPHHVVARRLVINSKSRNLTYYIAHRAILSY